MKITFAGRPFPTFRKTGHDPHHECTYVDIGLVSVRRWLGVRQGRRTLTIFVLRFRSCDSAYRKSRLDFRWSVVVFASMSAAVLRCTAAAEARAPPPNKCVARHHGGGGAAGPGERLRGRVWRTRLVGDGDGVDGKRAHRGVVMTAAETATAAGLARWPAGSKVYRIIGKRARASAKTPATATDPKKLDASVSADRSPHAFRSPLSSPPRRPCVCHVISVGWGRKVITSWSRVVQTCCCVTRAMVSPPGHRGFEVTVVSDFGTCIACKKKVLHVFTHVRY